MLKVVVSKNKHSSRVSGIGNREISFFLSNQKREENVFILGIVFFKDSRSSAEDWQISGFWNS